MSDELVKRLLDWPYQGETMAHEAADRIEALTAERDEALNQLNSATHSVEMLEKRVAEFMADNARLREEHDAILSDSTIHSDQRKKYERLCAWIAAAKRLNKMPLMRSVSFAGTMRDWPYVDPMHAQR